MSNRETPWIRNIEIVEDNAIYDIIKAIKDFVKEIIEDSKDKNTQFIILLISLFIIWSSTIVISYLKYKEIEEQKIAKKIKARLKKENEILNWADSFWLNYLLNSQNNEEKKEE